GLELGSKPVVAFAAKASLGTPWILFELTPPGLRSNLRNDGENSEFRYRIDCSFSPHGSNYSDVTAAAVGEVKDIPGMRIADITLAVFTFCYRLRFLAYLRLPGR